jgi:hypothetical protein
MAGSARLSVHDGLVVRTELDPTVQPFLDDHRIDGTPVLPGVMGMEAFAETARLLLPELAVVAVEHVEFEAPFKFYRDEARELIVTSVVEPDHDGFVAHCRLLGERTLPGSDTPQTTVHFTGDVRLGERSSATDTIDVGDPDGPALDARQVYAFYFHGPAYQVVGAAWRAGDDSIAAMSDELPPNHHPDDLPLATAPRLAELCFQTAGLWEAGREGRLALPMAIDRLVITGDVSAPGMRAVARQVGGGTFDCRVVTGDGAVVLRMDGYRTVPLPTTIPDEIVGDLTATYAERID